MGYWVVGWLIGWVGIRVGGWVGEREIWVVPWSEGGGGSLSL